MLNHRALSNILPRSQLSFLGTCLKILGFWELQLSLSEQFMALSLCMWHVSKSARLMALQLYLCPLKDLTNWSLMGQKGRPVTQPGLAPLRGHALGAGEGHSWPEAPVSGAPSSLMQVARGPLPSPGDAAHDPGAPSRENDPYWNHVGNVALQSQSLWVLLLFGKDHVKCLTKVFQQSLSLSWFVQKKG